MAARPSGFKTDEARAEYCRLYDEAIALSPVPVEESDVETSFGTTHVLTAGDPSKPPLVALHAKSFSSTMWVPLLPTLTASHHVRMLDAVGDVNKSVATDVMSSPARVVQWIDEVHRCARYRAQPDRGGVDRHLDGDALRNGTAWARRTAGDVEPRRHGEFHAHEVAHQDGCQDSTSAQHGEDGVDAGRHHDG